jgi:hypothetical protein
MKSSRVKVKKKKRAKIGPPRKPEIPNQAGLEPYFWRLIFHPGFLVRPRCYPWPDRASPKWVEPSVLTALYEHMALKERTTFFLVKKNPCFGVTHFRKIDLSLSLSSIGQTTTAIDQPPLSISVVLLPPNIVLLFISRYCEGSACCCCVDRWGWCENKV